MSDLVTHLRWLHKATGSPTYRDAADRIEELEVRLMNCSAGAAMSDMEKDKRIAELEAQLQVQEQESFGQLKPLQDKLQRVGELPIKWYKAAADDPMMSLLAAAADELQAELEKFDE